MKEIIQDGSLERLFVVVFVFGGIVILTVLAKTFDERLFDLAFLVAGFYFRTVAEQIAYKATQCRETRKGTPE